MTSIDETTGLPELPEGYVWEVEIADFYDQFFPGTYLGRKLWVMVAESHESGNYAYTSTLRTTKVLAYANNKSIRRAAARSLRKRERHIAKKAKRGRVDGFVGTYPPKRLGE